MIPIPHPADVTDAHQALPLHSAPPALPAAQAPDETATAPAAALRAHLALLADYTKAHLEVVIVQLLVGVPAAMSASMTQYHAYWGLSHQFSLPKLYLPVTC